MSLHRRAVDQDLRRRAAGRRQRMEDVRPDAFLGPAHKAIVECLARTIDGRRIDPAAAGLENVNDAADDAAVIDPGLAARVGRKMWLKPRELPLAQPKMISIHRWSPFGDLESQNHRPTKLFYGSGA